jgi:hypothetical protein
MALLISRREIFQIHGAVAARKVRKEHFYGGCPPRPSARAPPPSIGSASVLARYSKNFFSNYLGTIFNNYNDQ